MGVVIPRRALNAELRMAEKPEEPVNNVRRNVALATITAVSMGSLGGLGYVVGTMVRDQGRRNLVKPSAQELLNAIDKGDFNRTVNVLVGAKRYGILNEVVAAMFPQQANAELLSPQTEDMPSSESRVRFHLKNLRSAVDMRSASHVHSVLTEARREQVLENTVDQLSVLMAQDRPR